MTSPYRRSASFCAKAEGKDRPVHLPERIADRLAGFETDQFPELLLSVGDPGADEAERPTTLP